MELRSSTFGNDGRIAAGVACDGADRSPSLTRTTAPKAARRRVPAIDDTNVPDPTAPQTTWLHWGLHKLPSAGRGLQASKPARPPRGAAEGLSDLKRRGDDSTWPHAGRHRYARKPCSLDTVLSHVIPPTKAALDSATRGEAPDMAAPIGAQQR